MQRERIANSVAPSSGNVGDKKIHYDKDLNCFRYDTKGHKAATCSAPIRLEREDRPKASNTSTLDTLGKNRVHLCLHTFRIASLRSLPICHSPNAAVWLKFPPVWRTTPTPLCLVRILMVCRWQLTTEADEHKQERKAPFTANSFGNRGRHCDSFGCW